MGGIETWCEEPDASDYFGVWDTILSLSLLSASESQVGVGYWSAADNKTRPQQDRPATVTKSSEDEFRPEAGRIAAAA